MRQKRAIAILSAARQARVDAAIALQCLVRRWLAIRARERLRAASTLAAAEPTPPPDEVLCPITHDVMVDPVVTADGHSYERWAIVNWLARGNSTSPLTGGQLEHTMLTPNHALRALCHQYLPGAGA